MTYLPITMYGDKILRKKTGQVKEITNEDIKLIKDMFDTMHNANGVGLAANQVGSNKSIFVIDISGVEGHEDEKPMVFINPKIVERSEDKTVIEEGCLSIPDVRGRIERPKSVKITYQDYDLNEHTIEAYEILARAIQHEYDHLQGTLIIDYLNEEEKKKVQDILKKIKEREIEVDYPITENKDYQLK
ncbi:MAG TPA: peptide deformylase [Ignavibacteriaceae bacterium]|nr:peptide deformylase [Ignavibacteriaceae bacterium]